MEVILYKAFASLITLRGRIFDESTTDVLRSQAARSECSFRLSLTTSLSHNELGT